MSIDQLQPATQQQASVYLPYVQGARRNFLTLCHQLYQKGVLEAFPSEQFDRDRFPNHQHEF
ncbi:hypothetical protein FM036_42975 [Nostoc sp. HG1]|nr:hypothetical protein [Nostoc sp. HG1]